MATLPHLPFVRGAKDVGENIPNLLGDLVHRVPEPFREGLEKLPGVVGVDAGEGVYGGMVGVGGAVVANVGVSRQLGLFIVSTPNVPKEMLHQAVPLQSAQYAGPPTGQWT